MAEREQPAASQGVPPAAPPSEPPPHGCEGTARRAAPKMDGGSSRLLHGAEMTRDRRPEGCRQNLGCGSSAEGRAIKLVTRPRAPVPGRHSDRRHRPELRAAGRPGGPPCTPQAALGPSSRAAACPQAERASNPRPSGAPSPQVPKMGTRHRGSAPPAGRAHCSQPKGGAGRHGAAHAQRLGARARPLRGRARAVTRGNCPGAR